MCAEGKKFCFSLVKIRTSDKTPSSSRHGWWLEKASFFLDFLLAGKINLLLHVIGRNFFSLSCVNYSTRESAKSQLLLISSKSHGVVKVKSDEKVFRIRKQLLIQETEKFIESNRWSKHKKLHVNPASLPSNNQFRFASFIQLIGDSAIFKWEGERLIRTLIKLSDLIINRIISQYQATVRAETIYFAVHELSSLHVSSFCALCCSNNIKLYA